MSARRTLLISLALTVVFLVTVDVEVSHAITTVFTHSSDYLGALDLAGVSLVTETYENVPLNSLIAAGSTVGSFTYSAFPVDVEGRIDDTFNRIGNQSLAASRPGDQFGFFLPGDNLSISFPRPATAVGVSSTRIQLPAVATSSFRLPSDLRVLEVRRVTTTSPRSSLQALSLTCRSKVSSSDRSGRGVPSTWTT